jgi:hypothetical protein
MVPSRSLRVRLHAALRAPVLAGLLGACGNAPDAGPAASPATAPGAPTVKSATTASTASSAPTPHAEASTGSPGETPAGLVRLEGCVADATYVPRTGTPVRVSSLDGRPLGHATSGPLGGFSMRVVPQQVYRVAVDREGGESLTVRAGRGDVWMTACLLDPER